MSKILIIGAHGATARIVTERLLNETNINIVLFLRNSERLNQYRNNQRVTIIEGDNLDTSALISAMKDVDIIYSNAGGTNLADQTKSILTAMQKAQKNRLIFMSALGAHHEVLGKFGEWNEQAISDFLPGFRESATLLENSDVNYTELRPAWLTNNSEIDYELTIDEPFKGTEVSRASVADFILNLIVKPEKYSRTSVGLNKPNTDGDRPNWIK